VSRYLALCLAVCLAARVASAEPLNPSELAQVKAAEEARIQAIASVYGAVVAIYGNDRQGGGSGVLFDESGYALTNHHVVAAAGVNGWAGLADGKLYRWRLIGTDPGGDVAIIQLQGQDKFPTAPLGDSSKVRVGDFAMAMGNPFVLAEDQRPTVTLGIVSGVERFQPGSGMNQLVYGNCIQVDSSINPGNSGGPLFNLRGQVIGINGRGSFEERGRVNVGLGYAISANQCRTFVPELLSTKIAQHGTLDAVFGTREGKVICHTLNLDAPIARLGLQLGDELLAFEKQPIQTANQFTNLLSMLPAGWPCEVTFTREGSEPKTVFVRLTALPYESARPAPKPEEEEKGPDEEKSREPEKPSGKEKESDDKKPEEKKSEDKQPSEEDARRGKGLPMPMPMRRAPAIPLHDAGKIRDAELNGEIARWALHRWRSAAKLATNEGVAGIRVIDEVQRDGEKVGSLEALLARDGKCVVRYDVSGKKMSIGFDGETFWQISDDRTQPISQAKALRDAFFLQAFIMAQCLKNDAFAGLGKLTLDGSDKAAQRPAFRLKLIDDASEETYLWFSVFGSEGRPDIRLLKAGAAIDDDDPLPNVRFVDWQTVAGMELPRTRQMIRGLGEIVERSLVNINCEVREKMEADSFRADKP
jgi:S1-C subfamily serine protease